MIEADNDEWTICLCCRKAIKDDDACGIWYRDDNWEFIMLDFCRPCYRKYKLAKRKDEDSDGHFLRLHTFVYPLRKA
jgi:hypothetical protein